MEFTIKELDALIAESIKECDTLPRVCKFATTRAGRERIHKRVKEHILVGGIDDVDTSLALVEQELEDKDTNTNF